MAAETTTYKVKPEDIMDESAFDPQLVIDASSLGIPPGATPPQTIVYQMPDGDVHTAQFAWYNYHEAELIATVYIGMSHTVTVLND